jgi:ABC-type transport system substrate-binding protein
VQAQAGQLGIGVGNTQFNYDFQPVLQDGLSTIEAGAATNDMVDVKPGDMVYNSAGKPEKLAQGTKVLVEGKMVEYDGSSALKLPQLVVKYKLKPYTWSDGTAGSVEDIKLAYKINCDRDSGATTFTTCDEFGTIDYGTDLSWTITYLPGVQDPTYFVMPFSISPNNPIYPSHQVLADGRKLADVPAKEWATLPEIAEKPLSYGPWMITDWKKGQSIQMTVNPHYQPAPAIKNVTIVIIEDTNQAVAQLLSGDVDYLEKATLGAGAEVQTVLDAAKQDKVNAVVIPSPTWEHIDFNLFTK